MCREVEAATFEVISHYHEDEPSELDLFGLIEGWCKQGVIDGHPAGLDLSQQYDELFA